MRGKESVLWRGRLESAMRPEVQRYLSSFSEDADLIDIDCDVGEAHALTLRRAGLFRAGELRRVLRAYERARGAVRRLLVRREAEKWFHDIHPLVEKTIIGICGEKIGGRVHLGKSRNDQVAADIIIHVRRRLLGVVSAAAELIGYLLAFSKRYRDEEFPVLTHMRVAQPVTAGFFALAHAQPLYRDAARLLAVRSRMNMSPLGACAAAGTGVPLNRAYTARLLGFSGLWENALDATSARDCVLEVIGCLAILQSNLSRMAADVMHFCSEGIGLLEYPDELADTSSAMPHKKNPDPLELCRARAGRAAGEAGGALAIVHGLPTGYSRDLQELKPILWGGLEQARESLRISAMVVNRLKLNPGRAAVILAEGFAAALDLAEALSLEFGVPFRRAHFAVGRLVKFLSAKGGAFSRLGAAEASQLLTRFAGSRVSFNERSWGRAIRPSAGIARRRACGPAATGAMLERARRRQRGILSELAALQRSELAAQKRLRDTVGRKIRRA